MNFASANQMLARFGKVLDRPTQVPSPAALVGLMRDYVMPILQEVISRSEETTIAVLNTNELAQSAFVAARQTLAGDLMTQISDAAMQLRERLQADLPEGHPAFDLLDQIDANLGTFEEYLLDDAAGDEDEDEDGGEGGEEDGGEVENDEALAVLEGAPLESPVIPVVPTLEAAVKTVIDVDAVVSTTPEG